MLETITPPIDVPRAHLDPITTMPEKLAVFSLALMRPLRHEIIVLCCDKSRRGVGIFAFDTKLKLAEIIDRIIGAAINIESVATISLCASRAGAGQLASDKSQFLFAKNRCQNAGITLTDWLLVAHGDVHITN
jgi:hypothetical protein